MKLYWKISILSLVLLFGFAGFIYAKTTTTPAQTLFAPLAGQQNVQVMTNVNAQQLAAAFQQLQQLQPQPVSSNNNKPQTMAAGNIPQIVHTARGNFHLGGTFFLEVEAPPTMANWPYLLVITFNGDYPGLDIPGIDHIPLNPPFQALIWGILDPSGHAFLSIAIPNDPSLLGLPFTSAVGVLNPFPTLSPFIISNPVSYTVGQGIVGVSCCTEGVLRGLESQCIDNGVSIEYCRLTLSGAVQGCIPADIGLDPPPTNVSTLQPGNTTASSSFMTNLTRDIGLSNITTRTYNATTYDCDDFADDMEQWLQGLGYSATFTQFVKYVGAASSTIDYIHAIIDIHLPDGSTIWIEPQTGAIVNLDFDGNGNVGANVNAPYRNGHHPTEDNAKIYVYDSAATAAANGAPRD